MRPPCRDAFQMRVVDIARPPTQMGCATRKFSHMLAGATADLEHIAGLHREEPGDCRPDRFVIAMKSRPVKPAIGGSRPAIFAVLNDEFDHSCGNRKALQNGN